MRMYDIIRKKRDGGKLNSFEIKYFIEQYVYGNVPDYQASALLMAMFLRGLDRQETVSLTSAMINSGETVSLNKLPGIKADKHSSGGVGDKTTLVVAPLVAAAGVIMGKMSGRGLGHTGGTLDKLESIPGFRTNLTSEEFFIQLQKIGFAIIGQTHNIAPADKLLYALRDVTATVDSIPLIASSIMSKKIAMGSDVIVLDVKYGSGAFMQQAEQAMELAAAMIDIGYDFGKKVTALITSMDMPLGCAVGNALEVEEVICTLKGQGPADLQQLSIALAAEILFLVGLAENYAMAESKCNELLKNGQAWQKFVEMIEIQGGNLRSLPKAPYQINVSAPRDGYVTAMDTYKIGIAALGLGAGRLTKEDKIKHEVGLVFKKKTGDAVAKGDILSVIYSDDIAKASAAAEALLCAVTIEPQPPKLKPLIYGVMNQQGFRPWTAD